MNWESKIHGNHSANKPFEKCRQKVLANLKCTVKK